jgi:hypothetical protein
MYMVFVTFWSDDNSYSAEVSDDGGEVLHETDYHEYPSDCLREAADWIEAEKE